MYCILRTKKLKDQQKIKMATEHNLRLRQQANVNSNKSHLNQILVNTLKCDFLTAGEFGQKLLQHYDDLGVKRREDNVLSMEWVATASPEFFVGKNEEEIQNWANEQVSFFQTEFGDNLKVGILHLDEKTPHIHFIVSTEEKKTIKYKNQFGTKEVEKISLNAKRFNPAFLTEFQTKYAQFNAKFGLSRGKKSDKKHQELKEGYTKFFDKYEDIEQQNKKFKEVYPQIKKVILENTNTILDLLNILEEKELTPGEKAKVVKIHNKISKTGKNNKKTIEKG